MKNFRALLLFMLEIKHWKYGCKRALSGCAKGKIVVFNGQRLSSRTTGKKLKDSQVQYGIFFNYKRIMEQRNL